MKTNMRKVLSSMSGEQLLLLRIFEGDSVLAGVGRELDRRAQARPIGVGPFGLSSRRLTGRRMASAA